MNICHKIEDISKLYAVPLTAQIHHPSMPKKSFLNARSWVLSKENHFVPILNPFTPQDINSNSPYCLPNDSQYVSVGNLVSDKLAIP